MYCSVNLDKQNDSKTSFIQRYGGLNSGDVCEDAFWLLIEISTIRSEKLIKALYDYLVVGSSRKFICEIYDVNNGYFSVTLRRIQRINQLVSKLTPFYINKDHCAQMNLMNLGYRNEC